MEQLNYEQMKKIGSPRINLARRGLIDPSLPCIRRKPRSPEKAAAMKEWYRMQFRKYPPRMEKGTLILPFFNP
jgi:hypothetical protein